MGLILTEDSSIMFALGLHVKYAISFMCVHSVLFAVCVSGVISITVIFTERFLACIVHVNLPRTKHTLEELCTDCGSQTESHEPLQGGVHD